MNLQTALKLNQLNKDFYQKISKDFDESRNHFWPGWEEMIEHLPQLDSKKPVCVFDLGCGNGRLALFLAEKLDLGSWLYLGSDNSSELLEKAQEKTRHLDNVGFKFFDFVTWFYEDELKSANSTDLAESTELEPPDMSEKNLNLPQLQKSPPQIITCFGVTHHLPSQKLRDNFLKTLASIVSKDGLVVVSFWQFMLEGRFREKIISPTNSTSLKLNTSFFLELEDNDHILDWQRGEEAFRYCHFWPEREISQCVEKSGLKVIKSFKADSRSQQANYYLILQKI